MTNLKKYIKPKFSVIKISTESLLYPNSPGNSGDVDPEDPTDGYDVKVQTYRIFDDSFDDLSSEEESDYITTTNTIEVW